MRIIYDDEVRERFDFSLALSEMERILLAKSKGQFCSPSRLYEGNNNGDLAFTIGGDRGEGHFGFRVYPRMRGAPAGSQFTAVFDAAKGDLKGIWFFGDYLGAARTGVIGGIAIKRMAPEGVKNLGVIGSGLQAETQVRAACLVRPIRTISVYSRNPKNCASFCARLSGIVNVKVEPASSAKDVLEGSEVLITATSSKAATIQTNHLATVRHINAIGPKFEGASELPSDIYGEIDVFATDSLAQLNDYDIPSELQVIEAYTKCQELEAFMAPTPDPTRTLFLSVGLAGTEPCIAEQLLG